MKYAKGNYFIFFIGLICAGVSGSVYPVFSIFLSNMLVVMFEQHGLAKLGTDSEEYQQKISQLIDRANTYALIFFLLGVLAVIMSVLQSVIFAVIGYKVTNKIRGEVFDKMLRLPVSWF